MRKCISHCGSTLVTTLLVMLGAFGGVIVGCVFHKEIKDAAASITVTVGNTFGVNVRLEEKDIDQARKNIRRLLSSAQDSFVHRQSGAHRMAVSIDELGDGATGTGALIYDDIWIARYRCSDLPDEQKSDVERVKEVLSRPYRYAILPVRGVYGEREDALTTCIIALPVAENQAPLLVMVAGPIRRDPFDFRKEWEIKEMLDAASMRKIRSYVEASRAVDNDFITLISPTKEKK